MMLVLEVLDIVWAYYVVINDQDPVDIWLDVGREFRTKNKSIMIFAMTGSSFLLLLRSE